MSKHKDGFNIFNKDTWPSNEKLPIYKYEDLTDEELAKLNRLDQFYYAAMQNFYNSIVPEAQQVSPETQFFRLSRIMSSSKFFLIDSFAYNVFFGFMGTELPLPMTHVICAFLELAAEALDKDSPIANDKIMEAYFYLLENYGINIFEDKVLCYVQEKPTEDFFERDELTISMNDQFFRQWAGDTSILIVQTLKNSFHVDSMTIKVINKVNNPKAFKHYLQLKKIMDKIDDMRIIGV